MKNLTWEQLPENIREATAERIGKLNRTTFEPGQPSLLAESIILNFPERSAPHVHKSPPVLAEKVGPVEIGKLIFERVRSKTGPERWVFVRLEIPDGMEL
jgi:hypothetical protein